jgi:murein DD-endopeptidase MepM/ murein hydrolase activator NlpD
MINTSPRAALLLSFLGLGCSPRETPKTSWHPHEDTASADRAALQLRFPLEDRSLFSQLIGVDHDPVEQEAGVGQLTCRDYLGRGFPHCYDQHKGSDYMLIGGFTAMDSGSALIVAAAAGEVVEAVDGNYDHCHGDLATLEVDCDGHPVEANYVAIEHSTGHQSLYYHIMKESILVEVGQQVEEGDSLGLVGSSGKSYQPHLHFEVADPSGQVVDPYAGPLSQPETYWCSQEDPFPGEC